MVPRGTVDFRRTYALSARRGFDYEHEHRCGATEHEHDLSLPFSERSCDAAQKRSDRHRPKRSTLSPPPLSQFY